MSQPLHEAAARVVADLMPIAIVVAGDGAAFADALRQAGADAEIMAPDTAGGFDLAVLLAAPDPAREPGVARLVERLAVISDRLLFVPTGAAESPPSLDAWFELFAEQGYQPVVEYDAGFLARGAFLVDRNATAAESELAAFADRLSMGGALAASTERVAVLEAELGTAGDRAAMKAELAARVAELAVALGRESAWQVRAAGAEAELAQARADAAGWERAATLLGQWVRAVCAAKRPRARWWRRDREAAALRAKGDFDPAWYIASHPDLAASGDDPIMHYLAQRRKK
jgi:hypothetical protein